MPWEPMGTSLGPMGAPLKVVAVLRGLRTIVALSGLVVAPVVLLESIVSWTSVVVVLVAVGKGLVPV